MANLVRILLILALSGCGDITLVDVIPLETDTYISSTDESNHASLEFLRISKTASTEERAIVKIPTGTQDTDQTLDDILDNPLALPIFPFVVFLAILQDILDCTDEVLVPENLTNAKLTFQILNDAEGALDNKIQLHLLSQPWYQSVTWTRTHFFTSLGRWATPGGDVSVSFTPVLGTVNGSNLEFDVTTYFKSLIGQSQPQHYGFVLSAVNGTLNTVELVSTQGAVQPQIVSTYTGSCTGGRQRFFSLGKTP